MKAVSRKTRHHSAIVALLVVGSAAVLVSGFTLWFVGTVFGCVIGDTLEPALG